MKMALKCKKDKFLVTPLKNVLSVMGLVNHPRNQKLWAIAHENGLKMQKRQVFGHASEKCAECNGPCNSPQNPKTVGNSSQKQAKNAKNDEFFVMPLKHVLSVMGLVDQPRTPKLWAIAHENGHTRKNNKSFLSFLSRLYRLS
jgi:hypothetical protein